MPSEPRWVWAFDAGVNRVAFGAGDSERELPVHLADCEIKHEKGADRATKMWNLARTLPAWIAPLVEPFPPLAVWVEVPTGRPNPSLYGAYGVLLASIRGALTSLYEFPVAIMPIEPSLWKKHAIGKGNAPREAVHAWARAEGVDHPSGDVLDVYGILTGGMCLLGHPPPGKD